MSDAQNPDNEKLLRDLEESTKSLQDYLASHPIKASPAKTDRPTVPMSQFQAAGCVILGVLGFICLILAFLFAECALKR